MIDFDGNEISYPRNEWYKIRLAYAMSIHKSQGSEFPVVILPITSASKRMLERNLIYTAITRAKSKLILLGELQAFDSAIKHIGTARKTYLIERFSDLIENNIEESKQAFSETTTTNDSGQSYILTEDNWSSIPAMIGISQDDLQEFFGKESIRQPTESGGLFIFSDYFTVAVLVINSTAFLIVISCFNISAESKLCT